jgi:hypothetical protein
MGSSSGAAGETYNGLFADATIVALRSKIASKMEVSKFFAGFISVVLGFFVQGQTLAKPSMDPLAILALYLSVGAFTAALALSVATMCAYDRLLMPFELWVAGPFEWRMEDGQVVTKGRLSDDQYVVAIHREMRIAWRVFFVPAIESLFVGLVAASYAAASPPPVVKSVKFSVYPVVVAATAGAVAIAVHLWYHSKSGIVAEIFPPLAANQLTTRSNR